MKTRIAAIIPARMGSSRFPGKPLLDVCGLPMVEHVRRRALLCPEFSDVVVATCDAEIANVVESFGGRVLMTANTHQVATERVIEAMQKLDCTHVMNVQGDEILILPSDLSKMAKAMQENPDVAAWNAIARIDSKEELKDESVVKCVASQSRQVLFCARDFSFLKFQTHDFEPIYEIVGILGYSRSFLGEFPRLKPTPLELLQSIEQSRLLENGIAIRGILFEKGYPGINTPEQAVACKKYLSEDPAQQAILKKIL